MRMLAAHQVTVNTQEVKCSDRVALTRMHFYYIHENAA